MARPKTLPLSVVLATYNEAENIGRCLEAVKDLASEIVVVDGESNDETVQIARKYGAQVLVTTNKEMFHTNKQMAIDRAKGRWILQLDADEVVDKTLQRSVLTIVQKGSGHSAFNIKRKNYFLGDFLKKGGQYPDPVIRLFKRGTASLPQQSVHEQMRVEGSVGTLRGHLLHYNAPTFKRYVTNMNRYTSLTAQALAKNRVSLTLGNDLKYLLGLPISTFFKLYFRHRGYRDGFRGFVFALFSGLHWAFAYMKLGDLKRHESGH